MILRCIVVNLYREGGICVNETSCNHLYLSSGANAKTSHAFDVWNGSCKRDSPCDVEDSQQSLARIRQPNRRQFAVRFTDGVA